MYFIDYTDWNNPHFYYFVHLSDLIFLSFDLKRNIEHQAFYVLITHLNFVLLKSSYLANYYPSIKYQWWRKNEIHPLSWYPHITILRVINSLDFFVIWQCSAMKMMILSLDLYLYSFESYCSQYQYSANCSLLLLSIINFPMMIYRISDISNQSNHAFQ